MYVSVCVSLSVCLTNQCLFFLFLVQVYDTPPMVVKGPSSGQDIYDTPPSKDKNAQQMVRAWISNFFVFHRYMPELSRCQNANLIGPKEFTVTQQHLEKIMIKNNNVLTTKMGSIMGFSVFY